MRSIGRVAQTERYAWRGSVLCHLLFQVFRNVWNVVISELDGCGGANNALDNGSLFCRGFVYAKMKEWHVVFLDLSYECRASLNVAICACFFCLFWFSIGSLVAKEKGSQALVVGRRRTKTYYKSFL